MGDIVPSTITVPATHNKLLNNWLLCDEAVTRFIVRVYFLNYEAAVRSFGLLEVVGLTPVIKLLDILFHHRLH